jgi:peroxiredoxin Q/BCP
MAKTAKSTKTAKSKVSGSRKPSEGERAPSFDLAADGGRRIALKDLGGKIVVLYFYPKDDTSGCTKEAVDFTAEAKSFAKAGAVIVGVSRDSVERHDKFKAKYGLSVDLASDPDGKVCAAYGVWVEKSLYGRKFMGIERSTFLIGREGRIVRAWRKVSITGHVAEVLEAVRLM